MAAWDSTISLSQKSKPAQRWSKKGEESSVTFTVPNTHGEIEYYDNVANHAELGMRGVLLVGITEQPSASSAPSSGEPMVIAARAEVATPFLEFQIPQA